MNEDIFVVLHGWKKIHNSRSTAIVSLKNSGFSRRKIAKVLGIQIRTVYVVIKRYEEAKLRCAVFSSFGWSQEGGGSIPVIKGYNEKLPDAAPIEAAIVPLRLLHALQNESIKTVGEARSLTGPAAMRIHGIGKKGAAELKQLIGVGRK